jgi:hypothetical protein
MPIRYRLRGEEAWREGRTQNVSRSGVLFHTHEPLKPCTPVELHFRLVLDSGDLGAEVSCTAEIVRAVMKGTERDESPAAAAKFLEYRFLQSPESEA